MLLAAAAIIANHKNRIPSTPRTLRTSPVAARGDEDPRRLTASQAAIYAGRLDTRHLGLSQDEICMEITKFGWSKSLIKPTQNVASLTPRRGAMVGLAWAAHQTDQKDAGKALHLHVSAMDPLRFEHLVCRFARRHGARCLEGSLEGHLGFVIFTTMARTSQLPDPARAKVEAE
jgi:hypothetical protein